MTAAIAALFRRPIKGFTPEKLHFAEPAPGKSLAGERRPLAELLGEAAQGPLRPIEGAGHRFPDDPLRHVSIVNPASLRDQEQRLDRPLDPSPEAAGPDP